MNMTVCIDRHSDIKNSIRTYPFNPLILRHILLPSVSESCIGVFCADV